MHKIMLSEKPGYTIACDTILSKIKLTHIKRNWRGVCQNVNNDSLRVITMVTIDHNDN